MPNFSQIQQFLKSPACPKVLGQTDRQIHRLTLSDSSSTEVEIIRQNDLIPREQTNNGCRPTKLYPVDSFIIITFCHSSISLESSIGQATVFVGNVVTCMLLFVTLKEE